MAEIAGLVLGVLLILIASVQHRSTTHGTVKALLPTFKVRCKEYGIFPTLTLYLYFPKALDIMAKVEKHVIPGQDREVMTFMKSYTSSFNMIGVAGAIIAQVAITALSLTGLNDAHWTAEAFFVISLVTGALSVFFSCVNSPSLHGLHSADDIRIFLTKPSRSADLQAMNKLLAKAEEDVKIDNYTLQHLRSLNLKVASANSAVMLVAPMYLLNVALSAFLLGLGIYLGNLYTAKLVPEFGDGALGIFIIYIITTATGLAIFYAARSFKHIENLPRERYQNLLNTIDSTSSKPEKRNPSTAVEAERPTWQSAPGTFQQSVHQRENGKVRFLIRDNTEDPTASLSSQDSSDPRDTQSAADILDSLMRPQHAPTSSRIPQALDDHEPPRTREEAPLSLPSLEDGTRTKNIHSALLELIASQEQGLRASRKLLEAFASSS
ncbi:hypothetical protein K504DRAFT_486341 [Pleomassaria siparia CBS 279.74]|uniref:Uncharacterized protein n=1 Tax=Pleomassaria siparia CBS 279.74 TaxID=1314801 RepID=A0A6G1KPV6_9PLEO|nr:hypothetical protein K504DRAFT_486341 [Pleomassaria siparia CBS 279.74]